MVKGLIFLNWFFDLFIRCFGVMIFYLNNSFVSSKWFGYINNLLIIIVMKL